jgi:hypothetical protein
VTPEALTHIETVFHEAAHGVVAAVLGAKVHSLTVSKDSGTMRFTMFCNQALPVASAGIGHPQFRAATKDCTIGFAGIAAVMRFSQVSFWEAVQRGGWSDFFWTKKLSLLLKPETRPLMMDLAREWSEAIVEAEWGIIGMVAKILAYENEASETFIIDLLGEYGTQWEFAPWDDEHWKAFVEDSECDDDDEGILDLPTIFVENPGQKLVRGRYERR